MFPTLRTGAQLHKIGPVKIFPFGPFSYSYNMEYGHVTEFSMAHDDAGELQPLLAETLSAGVKFLCHFCQGAPNTVPSVNLT